LKSTMRWSLETMKSLREHGRAVLTDQWVKWYSEVGRGEMIAELDASAALFQRAEEAPEREHRPRAERLNMTKGFVKGLIESLIAKERARDTAWVNSEPNATTATLGTVIHSR